MYQAGAMDEPVRAIRPVAMNEAVPPKMALARLKLNANPVKRTEVGNVSVWYLDRVPSLAVRVAHIASSTSSTGQNWEVLRMRKAGTVRTMNATQAPMSTFLRPNLSEMWPMPNTMNT